jgi:hypothetical protein
MSSESLSSTVVDRVPLSFHRLSLISRSLEERESIDQIKRLAQGQTVLPIPQEIRACSLVKVTKSDISIQVRAGAAYKSYFAASHFKNRRAACTIGV